MKTKVLTTLHARGVIDAGRGALRPTADDRDRLEAALRGILGDAAFRMPVLGAEVDRGVVPALRRSVKPAARTLRRA